MFTGLMSNGRGLFNLNRLYLSLTQFGDSLNLFRNWILLKKLWESHLKWIWNKLLLLLLLLLNCCCCCCFTEINSIIFILRKECFYSWVVIGNWRSMLLNIYLPCVHWGIHRKMKLKKCIVGRPEYFDMVNKTKQKKIKLKKKETKTKTKK